MVACVIAAAWGRRCILQALYGATWSSSQSVPWSTNIRRSRSRGRHKCAGDRECCNALFAPRRRNTKNLQRTLVAGFCPFPATFLHCSFCGCSFLPLSCHFSALQHFWFSLQLLCFAGKSSCAVDSGFRCAQFRTPRRAPNARRIRHKSSLRAVVPRHRVALLEVTFGAFACDSGEHRSAAASGLVNRFDVCVGMH